MSQQTATRQIPAGWYPDPVGSSAPRWWDGTQWTQHLQPIAQQPIAQQPIAQTPTVTPTPEPTPTTAPLRQSTVSSASPAPSLRPISPRFLPWSTRSGWVLATLPAWSTGVVFALVGLAGTMPPGMIAAMLAGIFLLVGLVLALTDRRTLLEAGHRAPASAWWFLLGPLAYLIARAAMLHRITGRGWAPVVLWLACTAARAACVVLIVLPALAQVRNG